jgi:hypothetical protein
MHLVKMAVNVLHMFETLISAVWNSVYNIINM